MQTSENRILADRYRLTGLTQERNNVEVYEAVDERLGRTVQIQVLASKAASNPDLARTFLRHQQIASSIHNCPILAVYDAGTWQGRPFSVMERDKGRPAQELYRPGYPPDIPFTFSIARQAAETLQCCRDAGLSDWSFSPESVRIDDESGVCLAIEEGLSGPLTSSSSRTDAIALTALFYILLSGKADPTPADLRTTAVPGWLVSKLQAIDPGMGANVVTAADFARELDCIESGSTQPTEAYTPPSPDAEIIKPPERTPSSSASFVALAEAPTLPANVNQPAARTAELPQMGGVEAPLTLPQNGVSDEGSVRQVKRPVLLLLAGLLLVLLALGALLAPGLRAGTQASGGAAAATTPRAVTVPDLRSKSLDDARNLVGSRGLNLAVGSSKYDSGVPRDTVAAQDPAAGSTIQSGRLVTISLSLGSAPTPTPPPTATHPPAPVVQPQPNNPAPPPAHSPPGHENGKGNKGSNKHGKGDK